MKPVVPGPSAADPLAGLKDIHLPPAPSWWPPAPGWWLLGAVLVLVTLWIGWRALRAYRRRARLRRVLARLDELERSYRPEHACEFVAAISALLRRVALARYPREQVAPLSGREWLEFLDRHGGKGRFTDGPGKILAEGAYRPDCRVDPHELAALAREWISRQWSHTPGAPR